MAKILDDPFDSCLADQLFRGHPFDRAWCRHVLDSQMARLLVDDDAHPNAAVLQDSRVGFCFAAGDEEAATRLIEPLLGLLHTAVWPLVSVPSQGWKDRLLALGGGTPSGSSIGWRWIWAAKMPCA